MRTYLGVTASRGLAVGPVFRLDRAAPTARTAGLPELETARLNAAPSVHNPPGKPDASHGTPRHRTALHGTRCKEIPRCSKWA